jgi:hypothetical protein
MREIISVPSLSAVAAGQTATLDLPARDVYHGLIFTYTPGAVPAAANEATMKADLGNIRLKINGIVVREHTASQYLDILKFYQQEFEPGIFPIYFSEPWRTAAQGEDALSWGMQDVSNFQVEIDIASGATSPRLQAKAIIERVTRPLGAIKKFRRYTIPVTAAGVVNVTSLPKTDAYYTMHAFSANVADILVQTDGVERFRATAAEASHLYRRHELAPQSGMFHLAFDHTRRVADALSMMRGDGTPISDLRIDFNMTSAASFTLICETLGR